MEPALRIGLAAGHRRGHRQVQPAADPPGPRGRRGRRRTAAATTVSGSQPMTKPSSASALAPALTLASELEPERYVVPQHLATPATGRGPQFRDDVWDFRPFVPRTTGRARADFTRLPDGVAALTAKQYLYSRIHRPIPTAHYGGAAGARPLKLTCAALETQVFTRIVTQLGEQGAPRLRDVTQEHLDALVRRWRRTCSPTTVAQQMAFVRRIAAHGPYLSADYLTIIPWGAHRAADDASAWSPENTTPRIPEPILAPMLQAALFYVHTASGDLLAATRRSRDCRRHARREPCRKGPRHDGSRRSSNYAAGSGGASPRCPATKPASDQTRPSSAGWCRHPTPASPTYSPACVADSVCCTSTSRPAPNSATRKEAWTPRCRPGRPPPR